MNIEVCMIYIYIYLFIYLYEIYVWSMMFRMFRCDFSEQFLVEQKRHGRKDRLRLLRRHGTTKLLKVRQNR